MRAHRPNLTRRLTLVGIDAGGSSVRARAEIGGSVIHEGVGGPANALSTDPTQLVRSFAEALEGCPPADHVVACVAGAGVALARERVYAALRELQPDAHTQVLPDFAAAYHAYAGTADVVVIAGTGSVVCSPEGGGWRASGGQGWILGDHGSASRLGRAILDAYVQDPAVLPTASIDAIEEIYGERMPGAIVRVIHTHAAPGAALALAAKVLTDLAAEGNAMALELVRQQMQYLAETTAAHVSQLTSGPSGLSVGLVGGVWHSAEAMSAYARELARLAPTLRVRADGADPLDGALLLADDFAVSS